MPIQMKIPDLGKRFIINREQEIQKSLHHLTSGESVMLVAANELPGIGLTTLAASIASNRAIEEYFTGGILWGSLSMQSTPEDILRKWAGAMRIEIPPTPDELLAQNLFAALKARQEPFLLVLDNVQNADALTALYNAEIPNCTTLITTPVPELSQIIPIMIEALDAEATLKLLAYRIPGINEEREKVQALAQELKGHPLAITLIGCWLQVTGNSLDTALSKLQTATTPLEAAIELCDTAMETPDWRKLGVFAPSPATFSPAIARDFIDITTIEQATQLGLINQQGEGYEIHPAIAVYAQEKLGDGQWMAQLRHAQAYLTTGKEIPSDDPDFEIVWPQIRQAWKNLTAIEDRAQDIQELIIAYAETFAPHLRERRIWSARSDWAQQGLELARSLEHPQTAALTLALGWTQREAGNAKQALKTLEQALSLYQEADNEQGIAEAKHNLGLTYYNLRKARKAIPVLEEAVSHYQTSGDDKGQALVLQDLGQIYKLERQYEKARECYQQAQGLYEAKDNLALAAKTLSAQAGIYLEEELYPEAIQTYLQTIELFKAGEDQRTLARTQNDLASVYLREEKWEAALALLEEAYPTLQTLGDRRWEAILLNNIAGAYNGKGDWREATEKYLQALEIRRSLGDQDGEAKTLRNLGIIYASHGNPNKAKQYLNKALIIARQTKSRELVAVIQKSLSRMPRGGGRRR